MHVAMVFDVYDSKVTRGKGKAHVALYWILKSYVLLYESYVQS